MKRTLALTLALVLCLGLCAPALAAETDGTYYVDGQPVDTYPVEETPPMDEEYTYVDPYAEYEAAHPEEIAALDVDALIAGWGYKDMTAAEAFMEYNGWRGDTVEEAAKNRYIERRLWVQEDAENAPLYREEYPDAWAAFDADAFFQMAYGEDMDKAEYMAYYSLFSEEEFVDDMFTDYIEYGYEGWDDDYDWDEPAGEPTLTLVVNGVASEIAIEAGEGTTYADAAALRSILGDQAVAADATGSIAIRAAAEAAGWDVVWYDGGWWGEDREVCLWDPAAFRVEATEAMAGYQALLEMVGESAGDGLFSPTPKREMETLELTFTRFNSLDGNEEYTLTAKMDGVYQDGVVDVTFTFDLSQFLALLPVEEEIEAYAPFTFDEFKALLTAGKAELILDLNAGTAAYNCPLLDLLEGSKAGWHLTDFPAYSKEKVDMAEVLYEDVLAATERSGGRAAKRMTNALLTGFSAVAGPENIKRSGSKLTVHVETERVNAALSQLLGAEEPVAFFKRFDMDATLTTAGDTDMTIVLRPNMEVLAGTASPTDLSLYGVPDIQLAATTHGDRAKGTTNMELHIQNWGEFVLEGVSTVVRTVKGPRQVKDVLPLTVEPAPGTILTNAS